MATLQVLDAGGNTVHIKVDGAGTSSDPYVLLRRNFNQKSSATLSSGITVNTTSVVAKVANTDRRYLTISVETNDIFIKLQTAATDNDSKGIRLEQDDTWTMPTDAIYTGEVSCIKDGAGPSATIYVTEY